MKLKLSDIYTALRILGFSKNIVLSFWDEWSETRFHQAGVPNGPFTGVAVSGGSITNGSDLLINDDGFWLDGVQLTASITANGGYRLTTSVALTLFGARENKFQIAWRPLITANTTCRFGFHDTNTISLPVDGAWIDIVGTTVTGKTASNVVSSTTGTSFTLVSGTVYVFDVTVNAAATLVTFAVYNGLTGEILWTDTLTANIPPKNTSRVTHTGAIATNSGTGSAVMGILYMMGFGTTKGYRKVRG